MPRLDQVDLRDEQYRAGVPMTPIAPVRQVSLAPPPPPPAPTPQVVDRVAYWQAQKEAAEEARRLEEERRAEAQRQAEALRAQQLEAMRRLAEPITRFKEGMRRTEQVAAQLEEERRAAENRQYGGYVNPATETYARTMEQQDVERYGIGGNRLQGIAQGVQRGLNAPIPYAKESANVIGGVVQGGLEAYARTTPALNPAVTPSGTRAEGDLAAKQFAGGVEAFVPKHVWEGLLELAPGVGSVDELIRIVRSNAPEAARIVSALGKSEQGRRFLEFARSERGALTPDGFLPGGADEVVPAADAAPPGPSPDQIKSSIIARVRMNKPLRLEQEAVRSEELSEKSARIGQAFGAAKSPDELIKMLSQSTAGKLHTADFEAFQFPVEERAWMFNEIATTTKVKGNFGRKNAVAAIRRIEDGYGLRAHEEKLLTDIFGEAFVQAVRERGTDAILANIARMWTVPGVNPDQLQEIVPVSQRYFTEAVQQGADADVGRALGNAQKKGRGAFGIAQPRSLEANLENAVDVPDALGPTERVRVIQPFADATDRAVDDVVTASINAALIDNQLARGTKPEWMYAEEQARKALTSDDPLKAMSGWDKALAPVQLWRSFVTAFDNSFLGRQGWKMIASNPVEWVRAYKRSWQALASPEAAARAMAEVEAAPHFALGQRAKRPLGIVTEGGGVNPSEEFMSPVTRRVPLMDRAQRAYTTSANWLRQMSFERNIQQWEKHFGPITDDVAQRFIDNINNATMYGNVSKLGESQKLLGQTFFSIRAKASLPQFLMDTARVIRPGVDPVTRRIVATRFAGWLTMNMALLYAAKMAGAQSGLTGAIGERVNADMDPFSPKFGKIQGGGQTYDVWGGYAPLVRAVIGVGQRNENAVPNYVRNQLSPFAGVFYDFTWAKGRTFDQKKLTLDDPETLAKYGLEKVTPLFFKEVWDAWQNEGFVGAIPAGIAGFSGISVGEDFGQSESKQKEVAQSKVAESLQQAGVPYDGKEIDWRNPILDIEWAEPDGTKSNNRLEIAKDLGMEPEDVEGKSMTEIRARYIELATPIYMEKGNSEAVAKAKAGKFWDSQESVKIIDAAAEKEMHAYFAANPDQLQKAADAGDVDGSAKWVLEILGD